MNILLFVTSMLMLLAILTYGRLESFRGAAFMQAQFKHYMENTERSFVNQAAIKRYRNTPATQSEKNEKSNREKNTASSTLSLNLLIDKEERDANPDKLEPMLNILRNLIAYLYADQPFYQEMELKRPNFVSEIFEALMFQSQNLPKLKKTKELATINLGDPELNEVFTRMLKGAYIDPPPEEEDLRPFKPERGYYSLLDFVTIGKNKLKLRVYLASKQLLIPLFGDPSIVNTILSERYRLYREVVNQVTDTNTASQQFQEQFSSLRTPLVPLEMLDFGVSKTNPRDYD